MRSKTSSCPPGRLASTAARRWTEYRPRRLVRRIPVESTWPRRRVTCSRSLHNRFGGRRGGDRAEGQIAKVGRLLDADLAAAEELQHGEKGGHDLVDRRAGDRPKRHARCLTQRIEDQRSALVDASA